MLKIVGQQTVYAAPQEKTSVSAIGIADVMCPETNEVVQAWKKWRGWHAMPGYRSWLEADIGRNFEHTSMARVVDGGSDYEFEYIGDSHVRAYGTDHRGRRVSDIAQLSPRFGRQLKASYDLVRVSGHPHAFQGLVGQENSDARFVWFETVYLPMGSAGVVDHILNAAVYQLRDIAA
ncbi:MAG TPA: hypothetical protein VG819_08110 [Rhizomicrobium sp.]|nr:hypothetical protein [Rhizomicrobium sp.]